VLFRCPDGDQNHGPAVRVLSQRRRAESAPLNFGH
jgi:hypothetical protein